MEIDFNALDPKSILILVLNGMDIEILKIEDHLVETIGGYSIEIEKKSLYKLLHENLVIAPFDDVVEMCSFIKSNL